MYFSKFALATVLSFVSVDLAFSQLASSTYSYNPNGEIFNGKFLPGPDQWPGSCNDSTAQEQTPVAIETGAWPINKDITVEQYTFSPGTCKFSDLKWSVEDNGVKAKFDTDKCTPPSVTIPDDPDILTIGLGLLPSISVGEEVFGKEAGKTYYADQFHIHSKSEHSINGQFFEAEMHIVHLQGQLTNIKIVDDLVVGLGLDGSRGASVVGSMINSQATTDNPVFENLLRGFERAGCGVKEAKLDASEFTSSSLFDVYGLFNPTTCYMNYDGGLTTPTCDEIVEWNLATTPFSISPNQMQRLLALINDCPGSISFDGSTSRPIKPLNGRKINQICPANRRRNLRSDN
jgi:carbonic anhydrase